MDRTIQNLKECTKGNGRPSKSPCQSTTRFEGNKVSLRQAHICQHWLQTGACTLRYCRLVCPDLILLHFTDFTGYVLFIIPSLLAGVESRPVFAQL